MTLASDDEGRLIGPLRLMKSVKRRQEFFAASLGFDTVIK
jgi:hypothetical protein